MSTIGKEVARARPLVIMNKNTLKLRIIGDAVLPQTVKASDLGALLINWEDAVTATFQGETLLGSELREAVVSLIDVAEGSNVLVFAIASAALTAVGMISEAVAGRRFADIPFKAQRAIYEISKQADRTGWAVEIVADEQLNIKQAIISSDNPVPPPIVPRAVGTTTLSGRLLRVGGAKPKAEIRLNVGDRQIVYIDVNEAQARQLASKLYEDVSIEGRATWNTNDWSIHDFKATRVTDYQAGGLVRAFEELAELSGGIWKDVDPVDYLNELRSED